MTVVSMTSTTDTETLTPDKENKAKKMTEETRNSESRVKAMVAKKLETEEKSSACTPTSKLRVVTMSRPLNEMMSKFQSTGPKDETVEIQNGTRSTEAKEPSNSTSKVDKEPKKDDHIVHLSKSLNKMMSKFETATTDGPNESSGLTCSFTVTDQSVNESNEEHDKDHKKDESHKVNHSASLNIAMSKFECARPCVEGEPKDGVGISKGDHQETTKDHHKTILSKSLNKMMSKFETSATNEPTKELPPISLAPKDDAHKASKASSGDTQKVENMKTEGNTVKVKEKHSTASVSQSLTQTMSSKFETACKKEATDEKQASDETHRNKSTEDSKSEPDLKTEDNKKESATVKKKESHSMALASKFETKEATASTNASPRRRTRQRKESLPKGNTATEQKEAPKKSIPLPKENDTTDTKPADIILKKDGGDACPIENKATTLVKSEAKLVIKLAPSPERRETTPKRILVRKMSASPANDERKVTPIDVATKVSQPSFPTKAATEKTETPNTAKETNISVRRTEDSKDSKTLKTSIRTNTASHGSHTTVKETSDTDESTLKADEQEKETSTVSTREQSNRIRPNASETQSKSSSSPAQIKEAPPEPDEKSVKNQIAMWKKTDMDRKQTITSRKFESKSDISEEGPEENEPPLKSRVSLFEKKQMRSTESPNRGCIDEVRKEIAGELKNSRGGHEDSPLNNRCAQWEATQAGSKGPTKGCIDDVRNEIAAELKRQPCYDEGESSLGSLVSKFQKRATDHQQKQMINPFSEWTGASHRVKMDKNDASYGRPVEGSLTEKRGLEAEKHIREETVKLCDCIQHIGDHTDDGTVCITFGKLFKTYEVISDKVVGILLRARKYKYVSFEGEILFQNRDEAVVITLFLEALPK